MGMFTSKKTFVKEILFVFLMILPGGNSFALDLSDVNNTLASTFMGLVDNNEGLTSFPSLNITSGGREESLGGAFTGLSDDICFFDYNPAASCILRLGEAALFHNSWIADSNLESLAWADRYGDFGVGAKLKCFYVPFTEYNYFGERVAGNYYSETTAIINASYNFFHGYYFKGLAVGVNLKGVWRSVPDYTDNETDSIISGSGLAQSGLGIMADIGFIMTFDAAKNFGSREPNLRLGLSVQNLGAAFTGFGSQGTFKLDDPLPTAVAFGASYRLFKKLALTADIKKPINLSDFSKSAAWSAGAGIEFNVTEFFSVLGGFRLKGANPRISLGSEFTIKKIVFDVNYTFDLTSSLNPVNHFSLSARFKLGDHGRKQKQEKCDSFYTRGLDEYSKGNYGAAISCWEAALKEDKSFTPAKKWIETVRASQKLFNRVINIQSLD